MSKKNPPADSGFGDFEDDFFNSGAGGWGEPDPAEEARKAEGARLAEAQKAEAARVAAEARKAEETRVAAEARKAEEARVAAEAREAEEARAAAEARKAEEVRVAETARVAAEARDADAQRLAEEARVAEDARLAEEARLAALRSAEEEVAFGVEQARLANEAAEAAREHAAAAAAASAEEARQAQAARDAEAEAAEGLRHAAAAQVEAEQEAKRGRAGGREKKIEAARAALARPRVREASPTLVATREELLAAFASEMTEDMPVPAVEAQAPVEVVEAAVAPALPIELSPAPIPSGAWSSEISALQREAVRAGGAVADRLYAEAAWLARVRGQDAQLASSLLDAAGYATGSPALWQERVATMSALEDVEGLSAAMEGLAATTTGGRAADALVSAAAANKLLNRPDVATDELSRAASSHDEDARALLALVEVYRSRGDLPGQAGALLRLGSRYTGPVAGAFLSERAHALQLAGAPVEQVSSAWRAALEQDPSCGQAFLALERLLRHAGNWAGLAELYSAEGVRLLDAPGVDAESRGPEAAWWFGRAARVYRLQLFDDVRAAQGYLAALSAAPHAADIRHDYEVFCVESERWSELAASMQQELDGDPSRSFLAYRLARLLEERLGRVEEALVLHRQASEDPAAAPAAEAVLRILQQAGRWGDLVSFLEARLQRLDDPSLTVTVLYRMGETCEGPLDDQLGAQRHYERIFDVAPGYLPALEGLERVYTRLSAWPQLAAVYEQRALLAEDPAGIALQRHRAGAVYDFRLNDRDRAREQYRLALEAVPDFPASLDAYTRSLEADGAWSQLGRALRAAAGASRDSNEAVSLYYRAGRVLADRTDEAPLAMQCLQQCLELSPGFLPAILLQKELAARQGDWGEYFRLERGQADMGEDLDRRHWRLLAAAEAAQRVGDGDPGQIASEVLREDPGQAAALDLAERVALSNGDQAGLVDIYTRRAAHAASDGERVRYYARVAELSADLGSGEGLLRGLSEVIRAAVPGRPLRALARTAELAGYPEDAVRALAATGVPGTEEARLRADALGDVSGAIQELIQLSGAGDLSAATALIRLSAPLEARAEAHMLLSRGTDGALRGEHAALAGPLFEAVRRADDALAAWKVAFEQDMRPGDAAAGLRRLLIAARDVDGVRALYAALPEPEASGLGDALEEAGDAAGAIEAWRARLGSDPVQLPWSLRLEHVLAEAGEWKQVFELLQARAATADPVTRDEIGARCRWLLAEKLSETDEAWSFYQQLHATEPENTEILEALARIAGARGETALSARYLEGLASRAASPRDSARYQRRMSEALERAGDADGARAALTRALDVLPDDQEALTGLRRLAEAAGDWHGVVGVLARQAALTAGRAQVDRFAEIARLWEERLSDRAVAADAWRKVLELAPDDEEALRRLVALAEESGDWAAFVEHAQSLLRLTEAVERSALQRRIGLAYSAHLQREDDAIRYLDAASAGLAPDLESARALERLYVGRGEWDRVVDALLRRARAAPDAAERTEALGSAARIRVETLRDRNGASTLYEELLRSSPDHPEALRFRAEYLYETGAYDACIDVYSRLEPLESERDVDDFDAQVEVAMFFYRFADTLRRAGRAGEAVTRYERALALNPTHVPSLEAVGPIYMETAEWPKADKVWKQLLQLTGGQGQPETLARIYANLGTVEHHLGQSDKARKRFTKALELRPNDIGALRGYGAVLFAAADWNNLLNIYNNIIYHTQDPSDVIDAYLSKGFVLDARLGLPEKAAQHYEKSLAFDPGQPEALLRLAELALRRQDWPEAASLAERGLQMQDGGVSTRAFLFLIRSIAYQACGDSRAAQDGYRSAIGADPAVSGLLGGAGIDDYERVHEIVRARLQSAQKV